jgi:hypothetical protein
MPNEDGATGAGTTDQGTQEVTQGGAGGESAQEQPSINQQAKDLNWVKELQVKAAKLEKLEADAAAAEQAAKDKALADAGKFDQLQAEHKARIEAMEASHKKAQLDADLKAELAMAGFTDPRWVAGSVGMYNAETDKSPSEYAKSLAADEANKAFLAGASARTPHTPPGKLGAGGADWTKEKLHQMENSNDKKERAAARAYLRDYRSRHGKYPE